MTDTPDTIAAAILAGRHEISLDPVKIDDPVGGDRPDG